MDDKYATFNRHALMSDPVGADGKQTLGDFLAEEPGIDAATLIIEDQAREDLIDAVLTPREAGIWRARHHGRRHRPSH